MGNQLLFGIDEKYTSYNNYKWYFRAEDNPFDNTKEPLWSPYKISDNEIIEKAFIQFSLNRGCYNGRVKIKGYEIDFNAMMQINAQDNFKQRPVFRSLKCPNNIKRIDRYDPNFPLEQSKIIKVNNNNLSLIKEEHIIRIENSFPKKNVDIKVPKEIKNFSCPDLSFNVFLEHMISGLRDEAKELNVLDEFEIYFLRFLNKINEMNFELKIIKIYTSEGFIYSRINKIMRGKQFKSKSFENMKYYYFALIYSLQVYSQPPSKPQMTLYRGYPISKEILEFYMKCKPDTLIVIYEFLSTSESKEKAQNFFKDNCTNCLMTIEIPENHDIKLTFLELFSEFPSEKEILLNSGSILQFKSLIQNGDTVYINFSYVCSNYHGLNLFLRNTTLKKIHLGSNNIGNDGAKYIAEALSENNALETVELGINNIGDEGAVHISEGLKGNRSITNIALYSNNIGDEGVKSISEALIVNKTLKIIYLDCNRIRELGAKYLSDALLVNDTLQRIDLYKNQIGKIGAKYLSEALMKNNTLKEIDLIDNDIGDEGVKYISDALMINKSLQILYLNENRIGQDGAKYIAEALMKNETLQKISLYSNIFGDEGAKFISEALMNNHTLKEIKLEWNTICDVVQNNYQKFSSIITP